MGLALALLLALSFASGAARAQEASLQGVVVILHPSNGTSALDRSQVAQIFKGVRRSWNAQLPIALYLPPPASPGMAALAKDVFKVPRPDDVPTFYANAVQRKIFAEAPRSFSSDAELVKQVAAEPGAISVVDASQIGDAPVKALPFGDAH